MGGLLKKEKLNEGAGFVCACVCLSMWVSVHVGDGVVSLPHSSG